MNYWVNNEMLEEYVAELTDGHIKYIWGKKASPLSIEPSKISGLDCSGFVQYLTYKLTDGRVRMPAGSVNQKDWCLKQNIEKAPYSTAANSDGWLRLAFMRPKGKLNVAGHVWFIYGGRTLESYGSNNGPGRRSWNSNILIKEVDYCFKFARMYSMTSGPITVTPVSVP